MKNYKKILNLILLICGIISFLFLLLQAIPAFQEFYIKSYPTDFIILIVDMILLLALPIMSYFKKLRILTIILAVIFIILLLFKWQVTYPPISITYLIYSLLVIGFNLYFK